MTSPNRNQDKSHKDLNKAEAGLERQNTSNRNPSHGDKSLDRRHFLKATGVGIAATAVIPSLSAAEGPKGIRERAFQIRKATDSNEKYKKYLENHGFGVASRKKTFTLPSKTSSDGVSTQEWLEAELEAEIMLSVDCFDTGEEYYAEISWWYNNDNAVGTGYGEPPVDYAAFSFESNEWDFMHNTVSERFEWYDSFVEPEITDDYEGAAARVDDRNISRDDSDTRTRWFGGYITPEGTVSSSNRQVKAAYSHTWNTVTINDVSVGLPPILNVDVDVESQEWKTTTESDGETYLEVSQDEAIC